MSKVESIWLYDANRRVYVDDDGKKHSAPIYAKSFIKHDVAYETSRSWVLKEYSREIKIPKNPEQRKFYTVAFSEDEILTLAWVHDNAYKIAEKVRGVRDYGVLQDIAELVNYVA